MAKKFIVADLNDEKSKDIATVLGNKTARKILDYLADNDATETQIAEALNLPASTVNYNIQKLLKANFIEAKDFYWSPKGNKVHVYRAARKLIVIAPKHARGYEALKSIVPAILISVLFLIALFTIIYNTKLPQSLPGIPSTGIIKQSDLKKFSSLEELRDFIKANSESASGYGFLGERAMATNGVAGTTGTTGSVAEEGAVQAAPKAADFSATNIQVEGVDEADIVKNDGKHIYVVSNNKIVIVDAYPAENAKIASTINLSGTASEIFVNDNKLIVFGSEQEEYLYITGAIAKESASGIFPRYYSPKTFVRIYNIEDRQNPVLARNFSFRGSYYNSRMIGNYVYAIINLPVQNYDNIVMPAIYSGDEISEIRASDVYYFDVPDSSYIFTTINAINIKDDDSEISSEVFMMGYTQNMYVSQDNIYITYMKSMSSKYYYEKMIDDVYLPILPDEIAGKAKEIRDSNKKYYEKMQEIGKIVQDYAETLSTEERLEFQNNFEEKMQKFQQEIEKERQKTVIHRVLISKNRIEHKAEGEVPGTALNQFSMDEYQDYFRIATTTGNSWQGETEKNNVYVLNLDLKVRGMIEGIGEKERIHSARFIGDRLYLVTFKKTDPLFVINLENPEKPEVLGELKMPGYSDYLHPYDETHLIGIGKEAADSESAEFAWYQGIKVSLFDVSNVSNPIEISKLEIGDRGTDSDALYEHKAFLFSKSKNLLVLPISLYEINKSKYSGEIEDWAYGDFVWQGAYVFDISAENGIKIKGRITHDDNRTAKQEYYYPDYQYSVKRSLYMDDMLYTISQRMIKMNFLDSIEEINKVVISEAEEYYPRIL